jgi:hypothetical protein
VGRSGPGHGVPRRTSRGLPDSVPEEGAWIDNSMKRRSATCCRCSTGKAVFIWLGENMHELRIPAIYARTNKKKGRVRSATASSSERSGTSSRHPSRSARLQRNPLERSIPVTGPQHRHAPPRRRPRGPAARGLAELLQQRRQRQGDHGHPAAGLGGVRMTHQPLYLLVVVPEDKRSEHKQHPDQFIDRFDGI